jgi:hypothetical protein
VRPLLAALALLLTPQARGEGEIVVLGERPEQLRSERPGHSVVARPEEPTRFDTSAQLSGEAAVAVPRSGRPAAAGFAVPKIRGQDARLTDVFVGELHVQDPYAGLPLVDDLDLRAFGELVLHQGSSPPALPTVNPIGVLQLRFRPVIKPRADVGLRFGEPYGVGGWALARTPATGIYARLHRASGRYRHYADNGTPYNTQDDGEAERHNNDRVSRQVVPRFTWQDGAHAVSGFALWQESSGGLPARSARLPGAAREEQRQALATARYRYAIDAAMSASLGAAIIDDRRALDDPGSQILQRAAHSTQELRTQRYDAALSWSGARLLAHTQIASSRTTMAATHGDLARDAVTGYAGLAAEPLRGVLLELKAEARRHHDSTAGARRDELLPGAGEPRRERTTRGGSLAAGWREGAVSVYAQAARVERAPSLLEELGDGGYVRASRGLEPEHVRHAELGGSFQTARFAAHLAAFRDDTAGRIVLVPSLAETSRAENLRDTAVLGVDAALTAQAGATRGALGLCRLNPKDESDPNVTRVIPGVPEWRASLAIEQGIGDAATVRWLTRHQSETYRDPLNDIVVPAYTLHDASVDLVAGGYGVGVSVLNVFDVTALEVEERGGARRKGRTGLSDVWGEPLPGRQWSVALTASF